MQSQQKVEIQKWRYVTLKILKKLALSGGPKTRKNSFPPHPVMGKEETEQIMEVLKSGNISTSVASRGENFLGGDKINGI